MIAVHSENETPNKRNEPPAVGGLGTAFWGKRRLWRLLVHVVENRVGRKMADPQGTAGEGTAADNDRERRRARPDCVPSG